ncbi:unnamed protein product [Adineta steineri]|uniref:Uncharacterized protein n=1 Tax=Adineta steineri TaxID=433720 RepID=A0A819YI25_9BILA|nr:unnamed protein product [Adineta steineri]CAF4158601.1 unnamed protein product [Adineta steineri]
MNSIGQSTQLSNYSCSENDISIQFILSSSAHSAWNSTSNCSLQQCNISLNGNNNCLSSSTPCFDYRSINNISYCAPGILCSILETCDNITQTCSSNNSVCVINSCCSSQAVCIPFLATQICKTEIPISSFAEVTASHFWDSVGSATAQGDGLVNRINSTNGTYFNSGGYAPQYIQLELPGIYNISDVYLQVAQSPSGTTEHHLYVGSSVDNLTLATILNGATDSGQWISITYDPPLSHVQFLRLNSISSPSWISWNKFIVYDY